jgi:predicted regulator of Ras-like GTPase activity (Roadblock/LC7/MglB family)
MQSTQPEGFHGDVTGLSLSDVIQLNGQSGFSGCISVQHGTKAGRVFFREGTIIHAEQGSRLGEEAFYDIMEWRSGHFSLEHNVSTTRHTIEKSTQHLLIEAHRLMDERRAGLSTPTSLPPSPATTKSGASTLVDRVKNVAGVTYAVVLNKDGRCVGDESVPGADLGGKAAYIAVKASELGARLGAGDVRMLALHGKEQHFFLVAGKIRHLGVLAEAAVDLRTVEADVLKLMGPGK